MIRGALASTRSMAGAMASTRGGTGTPWSPTIPTTSGGVSSHIWHVPNLMNFQDAAKTTSSSVGSVVGASVNQGSDTHDIVQATAANKPTLQQVTINSVTSYVWRFDGTNDYLRGTFGGGAISQPFTMFAVAKVNTGAAAAHIFDGQGGGAGRATAYRAVGAWSVFAGVDLGGGAYNTSWNIWAILINGASSQYWHNGLSKATGNAGAGVLSGLTVGANITPGSFWNGDIGQILIYPGNISTADKNQVGEYIERVTGIAWTTI